MRVNLAAQILSYSVAAGVSTLISLGKLDVESKFTAEFVETRYKLFNTFNATTFKFNLCQLII